MSSETLEIGPATDIAISERVLRREGPFKIDERGVARGLYNAEVPLFSSADAIAIAFVLPKLREKCGILIGTNPTAGIWRVELEFGKFPRQAKEYRAVGQAPGLALAICRAALALADLVEGRK